MPAYLADCGADHEKCQGHPLQEGELAFEACPQQEPRGHNLQVAHDLVRGRVHEFERDELHVVVQPVDDGGHQEQRCGPPMTGDARGLWASLLLALQQQAADEQLEHLRQQWHRGKVVPVAPIALRCCGQQALWQTNIPTVRPQRH